MIQTASGSCRPLLRCGIALLLGFGLSIAVWHPLALAQDKPVVLARMTGITITADDLAEKAKEQHFLRDDPYNDPQVFAKLLDEIILGDLVLLEAQKLDLSKDWDYRSRARIEEASAALQIYQNTFLVPSLIFDSTQIDSFYHAHIDRYTVPRDQRKVRQITVYKKGFQIPKSYITYVDPLYEGWDPKRKVDSIYTRLANGEDFEALAFAHSEELKAKASKGELGWLSPAAVADSELLKPFFDTPLHQITKPFETKYAWIICQTTDERGPGPAPIDQFIHDDIILGLQEEVGRKVADAVTDSLVAAGALEYNDALMNAPDSLIEPGDAMAIINKRDTLWGAGYKLRKHQIPDVRTEKFLTREQKEKLLKPLVRTLFLYDAMRTWGYLGLPEVVAGREKKRLQHAGEVIRASFTTSTYAPDSAAIEAYYHRHSQDFTPDRRHEIESVRFGDRDSAQQAMTAWRSGQRPAGLNAWTAGPSDFPATVWNQLAAITPGSMIGPISAKGEYWLLHLVRIVPPTPLRQVYATIDATLRKQRRDQMQDTWLAKMTQRYQLVRYDDRLNTVLLPSRNDPRYATDSTGVG